MMGKSLIFYHSIFRRPAQDAPAGSSEGKENAALPEKTDKAAKCGVSISKLTKWEEHGLHIPKSVLAARLHPNG